MLTASGTLNDPFSRVPAVGLWRLAYAGANNLYLLGHNPGSGSFIASTGIGQCFRVGGAIYRVVSRTVIMANDVTPLADQPVPTLTLQTCLDPAGHRLVIVRAVHQ